jgi:hypothetical protein
VTRRINVNGKRNRKLIALAAALLTATLAFGLNACNGSEGGDANTKTSAGADSDAYAIYRVAYEKYDAAKGMTMGMDMDMAIKIGEGGESVNVKTTGAAEINKPSADALEMKVTQKMDSGADGIDMTLYYKDGYMYTEAAGQKMKQKTSVEDAMKQANYTNLFPEDAIKDKTVKEVQGGTELSFVVKGEAMQDMVAGELAQLGAAAENVAFGDANIVCVISNDGDLSSQSVKMDFSIEIEGASMDASISVTLSGIAYGEVSIDFPDDLDSYTEI